MLLVPPCFHHQAADAVAVHRAAKFFLGYRKTSLHRTAGIGGAGYAEVDEAYRKNRIRLSCPEKRINMLLSLEPLIYLESITNGADIL